MFQESHLQDIIRSGYVAATPRRIAFSTSVGLDTAGAWQPKKQHPQKARVPARHHCMDHLLPHW
jgi:hypothetical protein